MLLGLHFEEMPRGSLAPVLRTVPMGSYRKDLTIKREEKIKERKKKF